MDRILASTLLSLAMVASSPRPHAAPVLLRILTYNIHHGEGTDGRVDLSRLAGVMSRVHPDLVALAR